MGMINLDERLINETLRIRESYLNSIKNFKENEKLIIKIKNELNNAYILLENSKIDKEFLDDKISNLTKDINDLQSITEPIIKIIEKLKYDSDKLFENIKEKYPNITEQELKKFLEPHIKKIDDKFEFY